MGYEHYKLETKPIGVKPEIDPDGLDQHAPGAKLDAHKNRVGMVLGGFANAIEAVCEIGTYGANKYSDGGWKLVLNGEERYTDAMLRHLLAESTEGPIDGETGLMHAAQAAWNALARLELMLKKEYPE